MIRTLSMALAALAGLAGAAVAQAARGPEWIAQPNAEALGRAYPPVASDLGIQGYAVLHCKISAAGALHDCAAEDERPAGLGFGQAVLSVAPLFQIAPRMVDGRPVDGGEVKIPIVFKNPLFQPPVAIPAVEPERLRLAEALVVLQGPADGGAAALAAQAAAIGQAGSATAADALIGEITADVLASAPRRQAEANAAMTRLYAAAFSAEELRQVLAFFRSPAGAPFARQVQGAQPDDLRRQFAAASNAAAREAFCAARDCRGDSIVRDLARDAAAPRPTVTIPFPAWSQTPAREAIDNAYPSIARVLGVPGTVRLVCRVADYGGLAGCEAAAEAPTGLGFAHAALSLQDLYRVDPTLLSQGAAGETTTLVIRFVPPAVPPLAAPGATPRSPRALALAREMAGDGVDLSSGFAAWREASQRAGTDLSGLDLPAIQAAMAAGAAAGRARIADAAAALVAARYTDDQMAAALAFWRTPAGRAWKAKLPAITAQARVLSIYYGRLALNDAGRAYCAVHGCDAAPADDGPQSPIGVSPVASTASP